MKWSRKMKGRDKKKKDRLLLERRTGLWKELMDRFAGGNP
jgi:hypothetical protein